MAPCQPILPKTRSYKGIKPVLGCSLEQGLIWSYRSSCNTLILPVKKPGSNDYHFVHDLRAVNEATLNVYTGCGA